MDGLNISIYEREADRGEVASTVLTTTPGDQHAYWHVHANRRRPHALQETAATGLQSLKSDPLTTVDGICRRIHESVIGVVHYGRYRSDSIHLNRPRSDSDPIIDRSLVLSQHLYWKMKPHLSLRSQ